MFKAECKKIIQYDLEVSKDVVEFCDWILNEDDVFEEIYDVMDFLETVANKIQCQEIRGNEIDIRYQ